MKRLGRGLALAGGLLAVIGPWLAPHRIDEAVGAPYAGPSAAARLGTDLLGRDVLSRALAGGRSVALTALAVAVVSTVVGSVIGVIAAVRGGAVAWLLERLVEVLVVLPAVLVLLLVAASVEEVAPWTVVGVLGVLGVPWVARVVVAAATPVLAAGYVEHARLTGEGSWWIAVREVMPTLGHTLWGLGALRFAEAIAVIAAAAFLGVGAAPPAANWAVMVRENAPGMTLNPWATVIPASALALLAGVVTVLADRRSERR